MRQGTLTLFCPAVMALLLFSWGSGVVFAGGKTPGGMTAKGGKSYAAAYGTGGVGRDRDIIHDSGEESRAGSVNNGSVKVKSSESDTPGKSCNFLTYTVKKGDTLYSISRKTDASVESISEINRITGNKITPGMKLRIRNCSVKREYPAARTGEAAKGKENPAAGKFLWPLKNVCKFRKDGNEEVKSIGIFITGSAGSDVIASGDGRVEKVGYMRGYGRYVVVRHENRFVTVYSNLLKIYVREGEKLSRGDIIGCLSDDRTLHFQIGHAGKPENPLKHLPGRG